jgi:hypothetical protein
LYVEALSEARTKLEGFFNILPENTVPMSEVGGSVVAWSDVEIHAKNFLSAGRRVNHEDNWRKMDRPRE